MKHIINLTVLSGLLIILSSYTSGIGAAYHPPVKKDQKINFIENSWDAAVKRAKSEHKYIFVDAYAVWCGPCKLLKATTFKNKEVAAFFNANFVNVSIDMEKGVGIQLSEKWGITAYPTLLIIDVNGEIITGSEGFVNAKDLLAVGQKVIKEK